MFCVVMITVPNAEVGTLLAEALVEARLAACVSRVPGLLSTYRWQGKIEREPEELLLVKTLQSLFEPLKQKVQSLHPYTVPEIIALPMLAGAEMYLNWIKEETEDAAGDRVGMTDPE